MPTFTPSSRTFWLACLVAAGCGAGAWAVAGLVRTADSPGQAALSVLAVFAMVVVVDAARISFRRPGSHFTWSLGGAAWVVGILLLGPYATVIGGVLAGIVLNARLRVRRAILVEDIFAGALQLTLAGGVFLLLGGTPGSPSLPADYAPLVGTVLTLTIVNPLLMYALPTAFEGTAPALRELRDALRLFPVQAGTMLGETSVGVLAALLAAQYPHALPFLAPLAIGIYAAWYQGRRVEALADGALSAFANIVDERDRYTYEHSSRVTGYAMMIGRQMGLPGSALERLYWTSRLHDLGKIAVDNSILNKPGRLTEEEFATVRQHPVVSARVLEAFSFRPGDAEIVLYHHERFDGTGYFGRAPHDVPLESFVIAVADAYDAMTSDRPYRAAMPSEEAAAEIRRHAGSQFHPAVAEAFLRALDELDPASGPEAATAVAPGTPE